MSPVKASLIAVLACHAPICLAAEESGVPSLEMLEFLAEWSAEDQAWLDQKPATQQDEEDGSFEVEEDE